MTRFASIPLALAALAALLATPARAAESYDNCTGYIQSLPAVIAAPGVWCLASDLTSAAASGVAIEVAANNVTIDCNNFKLGGLAAGQATEALGIAGTNRSNTTIRNCVVRGFLYGMRLDGSGGGHVVEDNQVEGSTYVGVSVSGDGSTVRGNRVFTVGGTPVFNAAFGIFTSEDVDVLDNTVSGINSTVGTGGAAYGVNANANFGGRVQGNRVRQVSPGGTGTGYGLYFGDHDGVVISGNHVVLARPTDNSVGIACDFDTAIARDNIVNGQSIGIAGCLDAGGNDVTTVLP